MNDTFLVRWYSSWTYSSDGNWHTLTALLLSTSLYTCSYSLNIIRSNLVDLVEAWWSLGGGGDISAKFFLGGGQHVMKKWT